MKQFNHFVVTKLMVVLSIALAFTSTQANDAPTLDVKSVMQGHTEHLNVLKKIAACFNSKKNRKKALLALGSGSVNSANKIRSQCITSKDRAILAGPPNGLLMNDATTEKLLGSTTPPTLYYKSMSWGLGPSGGVGIFKAQAGFGLDGGFIWNLNGYGSTRIYGSSSKPRDGIAQLNLGLEPIVLSLYRAPVASGESVSYLINGSVEAGVGLTGGGYLSDYASNAEFQGLTVSLGAGVGFNMVTIHRVKSKVLRGRCPNVKINALNATGKRVKVIDVDFHDYTKGKWRSKPTPNERIDSGKRYTRDLNLEKVDLEDSQIRIKYRVKKPLGWSFKVHRAWSNKGFCEEGKTYDITLKSS